MSNEQQEIMKNNSFIQKFQKKEIFTKIAFSDETLTLTLSESIRENRSHFL